MKTKESPPIRFRISPEMYKLAEKKGRVLGKSAHEYARLLLEMDLQVSFVPKAPFGHK